MNQAQQPEALRLADRLSEGYSNLRSDLEPAAAELRRLHARVQELEAERASDDRMLRSSVPDRWKGCTSPVGSVQSYIAELEVQQKREPLTPDALADHCESWLQSGGASNIVDAYEAGYRGCERANGITAQPEYHADDERDHSDEDAAIAAGKVQAAVQGRVG